MVKSSAIIQHMAKQKGQREKNPEMHRDVLRSLLMFALPLQRQRIRGWNALAQTICRMCSDDIRLAQTLCRMCSDDIRNALAQTLCRMCSDDIRANRLWQQHHCVPVTERIQRKNEQGMTGKMYINSHSVDATCSFLCPASLARPRWTQQLHNSAPGQCAAPQADYFIFAQWWWQHSGQGPHTPLAT